MRQVIVDTETTGLEPSQGHRIIEIGCVEINHRRRTNRDLQIYLNPERDIEQGALEVHGISKEFLADKPVFADKAQELVDFIRDSEVIIHNAPFDLAFFNLELGLLGAQWGKLEDYCRVIDTLVMARQKHPGQQNSLNALCKRYDVDHSHRQLHGALLDAQILTDVYLAMTGGQATLSFVESLQQYQQKQAAGRPLSDRKKLPVIEASDEELKEHRKCLELIQKESEGKCIWLNQN